MKPIPHRLKVAAVGGRVTLGLGMFAWALYGVYGWHGVGLVAAIVLLWPEFERHVLLKRN